MDIYHAITIILSVACAVPVIAFAALAWMANRAEYGSEDVEYHSIQPPQHIPTTGGSRYDD